MSRLMVSKLILTGSGEDVTSLCISFLADRGFILRPFGMMMNRDRLYLVL